eukprot:m.24687 g.24687  ORF g.24687 m.24687 type:complete len:57 (-) comp13097_c0_seq1:180-350(-)
MVSDSNIKAKVDFAPMDNRDRNKTHQEETCKKAQVSLPDEVFHFFKIMDASCKSHQ